jgi:hypothetical protein
VVDADEHEKPLLLDDVDDSDEDPVDDAYPEWRGRTTPASRRRLSATPTACCLGLLPASAVALQNCGGAVAFSSDRRPRRPRLVEGVADGVEERGRE